MNIMNYVKFEHTANGMAQCWNSEDMEFPEDLSSTEKRHRKRMIRIACKIALNYGDEVNMPVKGI
jgi:hypothetical protein